MPRGSYTQDEWGRAQKQINRMIAGAIAEQFRLEDERAGVRTCVQEAAESEPRIVIPTPVGQLALFSGDVAA